MIRAEKEGACYWNAWDVFYCPTRHICWIWGLVNASFDNDYHRCQSLYNCSAQPAQLKKWEAETCLFSSGLLKWYGWRFCGVCVCVRECKGLKAALLFAQMEKHLKYVKKCWKSLTVMRVLLKCVFKWHFRYFSINSQNLFDFLMKGSLSGNRAICDWNVQWSFVWKYYC